MVGIFENTEELIPNAIKQWNKDLINSCSIPKDTHSFQNSFKKRLQLQKQVHQISLKEHLRKIQVALKVLYHLNYLKFKNFN